MPPKECGQKPKIFLWSHDFSLNILDYLTFAHENTKRIYNKVLTSKNSTPAVEKKCQFLPPEAEVPTEFCPVFFVFTADDLQRCTAINIFVLIDLTGGGGRAKKESCCFGVPTAEKRSGEEEL